MGEAAAAPLGEVAAVDEEADPPNERAPAASDAVPVPVAAGLEQAASAAVAVTAAR